MDPTTSRSLELPDDVYRNVARVADDSGLTPAEWIAASVSRSNGPVNADEGQPSSEQRPLSEALQGLIGVVDSSQDPPCRNERSRVGELIAEKFRNRELELGMATLTDAGPLVALIDRGETEAQRLCRGASDPFNSTYNNVALSYRGDVPSWRLRGWRYQQALWSYIDAHVLTIHAPTQTETQRMQALMNIQRPTNGPCRCFPRCGCGNTAASSHLTLDGDFRVYRINDSESFDVVPPEARR